MRHSQNSIPVDSAGLHNTTDRNARHVPRSRSVEIPAAIEQAVGDAVARGSKPSWVTANCCSQPATSRWRRSARRSAGLVCSRR